MRALRWCSALCALALAAPAAARADDERVRAMVGAFRAIDAWQVGEARTVAERAWRETPDDPVTLALMAEVKLHLGDHAGAVRMFSEARSGGAPAELLRDLEVAESAARETAGYVETVSEHFVIRHGPGRDAILVPYTIETLEAAVTRIGDLFGWRPDTRVVVELYPAASTLAAVSSLTREEIATSGTIALCRWNRLMVTTPRAVVFGYAWRDTLAHELVHLIIGGASRNTVPIWLHEGLAKFAETAWRAEPGIGLAVEQEEALVEAAKKGRLIPFERMHPSMAKLKSQEETSLAFAEVFTFIEFLVERRGWEGIRAVMGHLAAGATQEVAIERVHGESLESLERRWQRALKTREVKRAPGRQRRAESKVVLKDRTDTPDDALHGLDQAGRRHARAADLLFARGRLVAAKLELERAHALTRSPLISAKLAQVALAANDLASAERAARAAIDGETDLAGPNVTLAEILVRAGKKAEAKAPLARAVDINPFDPRIHAVTLALLGEGEDPAARRHAELALGLLGAGRGKATAPDLGRGASLVVEGAPFLRVFLKPADGPAMLATGHVTPTPPITLAPGEWELELVPPTGAPTRRKLRVEPSKGGAPQRVEVGG